MLSVKSLLILTMFLAGGLAAAQGALNTQLSKYIGSPFQASFISFCIGAFILGCYLLVSKQNLPSLPLLRQVPLHYYLGGICGSVFITCMIFLIPRIGVVNVLFLGLAGQMIVSVAIDSFGLFGLKPQQLSLVKIMGVSIILIGVGLLNYDARNKKSQASVGKEQIERTLSHNNDTSVPSPVAARSTEVSLVISNLKIKREQLRLRKEYKRTVRLLRMRRNTGQLI